VITERDLGWMAGVMDLRGKTKLVRAPSRNERPLLAIYVESKELEVVDELGRLTGTKVTDPRESLLALSWERRGCGEHCPEPHVHVEVKASSAPTSRWHITGAGAVIVLNSLIPRMRTNRGLSELLAEGIKLVPPSGRGRGAIDKTIMRMMKLGWPIPATLVREEGDEDGSDAA
jgi:hypothetical protein